MKNNKGKGRGLINFLPLKKGDLIRGRGLIWEGDVIEDLGYMYVYIMRNDKDVMVNFVPGEYIKKDVLPASDTGGSPPNGSRLCDLLVTSPYALP